MSGLYMIRRKEIIRDQKIELRMSKEEKELFYKFAEDFGINPSRLARNIIMREAESLLNKYVNSKIAKAYIKYAEITKNKEILERIKTD
jgi:hypothetical protein